MLSEPLVQCVFTATYKTGIFVAGGLLRYRHEERVKRMVFLMEDDERRQAEEALTYLLETMKRPCRIDLRTDLFWLRQGQTGQRGARPLAAAMNRHTITWTMVPPTSVLIESARSAICADAHLLECCQLLFGEKSPVKIKKRAKG